MTKLLTLSVAAILCTALSFAQIPVSPSTAPQPQLVPCSPNPNPLIGETWAFNDVGPAVAQVGTFTIQAGGRRTSDGLSITGTQTSNSVGNLIERLMPFTGSIDTLCLAGTNTLAAGTLQIADGLIGEIFTWSFPISFSGGTFNVTSMTTMNLRLFGALDPAGLNTNNTVVASDPFGGIFASTGTANLVTNQVPCPANPNLALDVSVAPHGFTVTLNNGSIVPGTLTFIAGTGPVGTVTGNLIGNSSSNPQPTETGTFQVLPGCTGFVFNIPFIRGGRMFGSTFDGVFAAGDFSKAFFVAEQAGGPTFTMTRNP